MKNKNTGNRMNNWGIIMSGRKEFHASGQASY